MKKINLLFGALLLTVAAYAQTAWQLDKVHSNIKFTVTHMVIAEVEGAFKDFDAKVVSQADDFNGAEIEFSAKVASIDTDNEKRDGHLKSDDFFNAEKFPTLNFKGTLVKENGKYSLKGNLTMRDVTKPVVLDVVYKGSVNAFGGVRAGFTISGKVNRFDYGLKWNKAIESGSLIVGEEVALNCKVELTKG
ncbi:MAG: YceI family protein [Flammeovirgaceae bacterium]|nr:YceI family protein [Flammeovirgaceae bacterium]